MKQIIKEAFEREKEENANKNNRPDGQSDD